MSSPVSLQMQHHLSVLLADEPNIQSVYARMADDEKNVTVYVFADEHYADVYERVADAESSLMALFPTSLFIVRVLALQGRLPKEVAHLFVLHQQDKVF